VNLYKTAQYVAWELAVFPDNYSDLLKLKGVGEYTAASRDCSFLEVVPVVDGNVFRIVRYFDVETDIAWFPPKGVCSYFSN
jgi:A/G-specific adenine glycosylase